MNLEQKVAGHYTHGALAQAIREAVAASGKDLDRLTPQDLAPIDQFHLGGAEATAALFAQVAPSAGARWLDIGSGLGGPARHLALTYGCTVTGIDLTAEYVAVANDLAARVGLAGKVSFRQGSALNLPFEAASFDGASLLHVGMNIEDKAALFAGVHRVLRPGGVFAIYDVMRVGTAALEFPVPWAAGPETSFVATPAAYRAALTEAGFTVTGERDRTAAALAVLSAAQARIAAEGRPALGLHILFGADAAAKSANLARNLKSGIVAPTEMIARA